MKRLKSSGFAVLELLFVLVVLGLVVGTGLFIVNQKKDTMDTAKSDTFSESNSDWLLYKSADGKYEIRLADGWELTRISDGRLYTEDMSKLTLKPGTKATIRDYDANSPSTGFVMWYKESSALKVGTIEESLKTNQGLTVEKYIYVQEESIVGSGLLQGGKSYNYYVTKGGMSFEVTAKFQPGDTDTHGIIEDVIKTLKIY